MQRMITLALGAILSVTTAFATSTGFTVEQHATSDYGTTYRVYATFDDPGDWVSSVYGIAGDEAISTGTNIPMSIMREGTATIYHTVNAFGLNPNYGQEINALYAMIPDSDFDSWLTIGAENSSAPGPQGAGMADAFTTFNQGIGFEDCGGAWFVGASTPHPAWQSGDDFKVLLAQITMTDDASGNPGHFSFQLNLQWKNASGTAFYFIGDQMSSSDFVASVVPGCTDSSACNYSAAANQDDSSCEFTSCLGCTDSTACNYDAAATIDNGQCEFTSCLGCTDSTACNYNAAATIDNGQCVVPVAADCEVCNGSAISVLDADGDGVCDGDEITGCTDEAACNYDATPTTDADNALCTYADGACEICSGGAVVLQDDDQDGVCNVDEIEGCQDNTACNFNANATNAGSCDYTSCSGCTDDSACNYDGAATIDDGNCTYAVEPFGCDGNCLNDSDADGICDELEILGCSDESACNYNSAATDEGDCVYPPVNGDCNSVCDGDFDGDGVCDNLEVAGCTSSTATNYNVSATDDDGTCTWEDAYFTGLTYEIVGHNTVGNASTYRVYANFNSDDIEIQACYGSDEWNWNVTSTAPFYQDPMGSLLGHSINSAFFPAIPSLTYDSWLALGAGPSEMPGPSEIGFAPNENFETNYGLDFNANGGFTISTAAGASIYYVPGASDFAHPQSGRVLLGQFTTSGVVTVKYNFQYRDADLITQSIQDLNLTFPANLPGCTDPIACNYDAGAEFTDIDACIYPDACDDCTGQTDGTGTIIDGDQDDDGVCDGDEITGCTDSEACNYDATSTTDTDNTLCIYASGCDICSGDSDGTGTIIDGDADDDGICDAEEITGCTDSEACNYDATSTTDTDNDLCIYPTGCEVCSGADDGTGTVVDADADDDGVCDGDEITGCTDANACNYDSTPTTDTDNDLCIYPDGCELCSGESDGSGVIVDNDDDGDGICNQNEIPGCTDSEALNFDSEATDNNGTCVYGECNDPLACNYVEGTEIPEEEACTYPAPFFDCEGNCTGDYDGDGICEGEEILGCASNSALNFNPAATSDDGSCIWGDGVFLGLTYEVVTDHETGPIAGNDYVTYRVFAEFSTPDIDLVQLFGNAEHPWVIENTGDVFQSAVGGDFGGNIPLALFSFFPEVEYDSWLTIGAAPGDYNAMNQSGMYAYLPEWNATGTFNANGTEALISVTPTQSTQGVPDADGRVLLAQITTNGVAHVQYNILFQPEVGAPITFTDVELTFPTQVAGCTNPTALNYEPNANSDDGSCNVEGCTDESAQNYNPDANIEDGSCEFAGCTDDAADNYDANANVDDGSCLYTGCTDDTADNFDPQANTGDPAEQCDYLGCTNPVAVNFDEGANVDDGSCLIVGCFNPEASNYNPAANHGNQLVLCLFLGCTDPVAVNYDPSANSNDGSCDYLGCTSITADNFNPMATIDDGSCFWYGCTDQDADNYDEQATIDDDSCEFTGCFDPAADNYDLFANVGDQDELCEYWGCMDVDADNYDSTANAGDQEALCIYLGCTDDTADNFDAQANEDDGSCEYLGCTDSDADNFDPTANVDDGSCIYLGCTTLGADNYDSMANQDDGSCLFSGCQDPEADNYDETANTGDQEALCEYLGCTNPDADNFDLTANTDDGACIVGGCMYIDAANFNMAATYDDGTCQFQTVGCTDPTAYNYMEGALQDNGTCLYGGCTYDIAFNFDPDATIDDGSCEWYGCTDTDAVNFDADATHDDGTCEVVGCLDPDGINFNANATFSGYCEYADVCPGDINGDLSVDVQDLLTFFQYYGTFCE